MKMLPLPVFVVTFLIGCMNAEDAIQVVSYEESQGKYRLDESALYSIERLPSPVRVLAAVGDARIGKSTFLNMVHLHWDPDFTPKEKFPFEVGSAAEICTRGIWVHTRRLPEGGSLILVDVEGVNLGNDAVAEQVMNNAALKFLYHTAKIFPDSARSLSQQHLGIAIRDALDLNPNFSDRQSEVVYYVTNPIHKDGNDDIRREVAAVFLPERITAFEIKHQDRKQLQNLQALNSGPYFESAQQVIQNLKKTMPAKLTPNGMEMCGGDLVEMIRRLFDALENGDVMVLETAFERLEKQMCDEYYSEWISPLMRMDEDDFMSNNQKHLKRFGTLCKLDIFLQHVQQEIDSRNSIIKRERNEREQKRKAEEEQKKAEEEKRKAEEAARKADQERRRQETLKREAELALLKEEQAKKQAEQQAAMEKAMAEEKRRIEAEKERQLQERLKREQEERQRIQAEQQRIQQELNQRRRRRKKKKGGCVIM